MVKDPTELIHCDNCGEDYAAAYRRCPFCNAKQGRKSSRATSVYDDFDQDFFLNDNALEDDLDYEYAPSSSASKESHSSYGGGKRLVTNRRGGGYGGGIGVGRILAYGITALVVAAAIWVVVTQLLPRLLPDTPEPTPTPPVVTSAPTLTPSPEVSPTVTPEVTPEPGGTYSEPLPDVSGMPETDTPAVSQSPSSQVPASQAPAASSAPDSSTGNLKLSSEDFTLSSRYPTYQMEIEGVGRAQATYVMSDESVAGVNSTGYITAKKNGVTKLTVTATDGRTATAIVRVSGFRSTETGSAQPSEPVSSTTPEEGAKLSSTDFTLSSANGNSYRLRVSGGTASYWTSSNEAVATVSSNGTVSAAGKGTARITCGLTDGTTLTCIVRVN